jgi:hypothetical protein
LVNKLRICCLSVFFGPVDEGWSFGGAVDAVSVCVGGLRAVATGWRLGALEEAEVGRLCALEEEAACAAGRLCALEEAAAGRLCVGECVSE